MRRWSGKSETQLASRRVSLILRSRSMIRCVRFWAGFLGVGAGIFLMLGCGASGVPKAKVDGSASLDDKPIEFGIITFNPHDSQGSPAQTFIRDGTYSLPAVNFGKYTVDLTAEAD